MGILAQHNMDNYLSGESSCAHHCMPAVPAHTCPPDTLSSIHGSGCSACCRLPGEAGFHGGEGSSVQPYCGALLQAAGAFLSEVTRPQLGLQIKASSVACVVRRSSLSILQRHRRHLPGEDLL